MLGHLFDGLVKGYPEGAFFALIPRRLGSTIPINKGSGTCMATQIENHLCSCPLVNFGGYTMVR